MPPKSEVDKILDKFDKNKRERILAYLNSLYTEQQELYFLRQSELQQNKILIEFEAYQGDDVAYKVVPQTIASEFRFAKLQELEEEELEEQIMEEEFNINQHFADVYNAILPIDYLLENKDKYFIKQILYNALFAATQKKFEQFYNFINKIEDDDQDIDKSNILLFYLSDKVAPAEALFKQYPHMRYLKISQMFVQLRQLLGSIRASQYFFVQAVSPRCQFLINCSIFYAKVDTFGNATDFTRIYVRDFYDRQQQNEMLKIKQLQVNPYLISLTYLTEEVESLFELKGFEEYRSDFLPEYIKYVEFRLFYFRGQQQNVANEEKIKALEQEVQLLRYYQEKLENEKKQAQCRFLTASDETVCMRWAGDVLKQTVDNLDVALIQEPIYKDLTFFNLYPGMQCEFKANGEVTYSGAVLGLKNSAWHRCDQLDGGNVYCGTEWRGPKVVFKFV